MALLLKQMVDKQMPGRPAITLEDTNRKIDRLAFSMERRFAKVDRTLKRNTNSINAQIKENTKGIKELKDAQKQTNRNINFLVETVSRVATLAEESREKTIHVEKRLDQLEKNMATQFAEQTESITTRLDRFLGLYEKHVVEITAVKSSIARHERIMPELARSA
jgi:methyl-accepting chemotaxis protein